MVNPRKVYPIDMGLIPIYDAAGRSNLGHALETTVLLELERRGAEISYVRTASGFEVDFLARYPEGHRELIQVCADLDEPTTRAREVRALVDARREYRDASLHIITLAPEVPPDLPKNIRWHPASAWLLMQSQPAKQTRSRKVV
jgi:predicted AAA+ superfamily ATPase